ncbi:ATP-grasp domain-containing protein [Butyrivibrio sp. AE3006]|uniref:ATP-grasp domain-containing protein n=1 Tax=Butyrivibrio sp. AE3006 TaxID=1280673 RepID=UPI0004018652|nr:ATP-grasp domain-containing protein [Butyrivibrio sp. AE3006]
MDKLLLLGNNYHVDSLLKCAQDRGIYVIVTDNLPVEESPVKKMADEYWDISITDIDLLEKEIRNNGVNGILCGASELCMDVNIELCKRLDLPCYVPENAWEITGDKVKFKNACRKHNVPVAEDFSIDEEFSKSDLEKISYPVIIKPIDGCSSIGIHVCNNETELIEGYKDAINHSNKKQAMIEKYYSGKDVMLMFFFKNGKAEYVESCELIGDKKNGRLFVNATNPSKHVDYFKKEIFGSLYDLFSDLNCNEGLACVQGIMTDGKFVVIEMNYRFPGCSFMQQGYACDLVLNYIYPGYAKNNLELVTYPALNAYDVWLRCGKISRIDGIEKIKELIPGVMFDRAREVGDVIVENSGMRQMYSQILFFGDVNDDDMRRYMEIVNKYLVVEDQNGNDMVCRYKIENGRAIQL